MASQIDYQRFRRDETCVEEGCRARKFYIEDGKKFCRRGHEQTGFTQTQQDEDDWNAQGKKSRKQREEKDPAKSILRGNDAKELYLQCYQLVLWKQCHWLIAVKGLPKELEVVVRDLWGLRLGFFHKPLEEKSGYSSGTGTMMFSSTSEGEDTDGSRFKSVSSRRSKKSMKNEGVDKLPKLMETMALVYLGMLLMRLPVSLGEILKWITRDEILYNRAIKEIPRDMRVKLPSHFHVALEVRAPFNGNAFHRTILSLVDFFHAEFDMEFPPLNVPLLLFKHVRDLGLPIEVYPAVQRLSKMLNIGFSYPALRQSPRDIRDPEVQLVTLIVVATKLSQPFDTIERIPTSESDASAVKIDWDEWQEIMQIPAVDGLQRGKEIEVNDNTVMGMDGKEIDDYLDWFQRMWLDDRELKVPLTILDKFPLPDITSSDHIASDSEDRLSRLKRVQHSMTHQICEPDDENFNDVNRPGDKYSRYRKVRDIPDMALPFFNLAAENAGIRLDLLVQRVYEVEGRLMKWNLEERRRQVEQGVIDSGGDP